MDYRIFTVGNTSPPTSRLFPVGYTVTSQNQSDSTDHNAPKYKLCKLKQTADSFMSSKKKTHLKHDKIIFPFVFRKSTFVCSGFCQCQMNCCCPARPHGIDKRFIEECSALSVYLSLPPPLAHTPHAQTFTQTSLSLSINHMKSFHSQCIALARIPISCSVIKGPN